MQLISWLIRRLQKYSGMKRMWGRRPITFWPWTIAPRTRAYRCLPSKALTDTDLGI